MGLKDTKERESWEARVSWMRDAGVTDADWNSAGELIHATLGPKPGPPPVEMTEDEKAELQKRVQQELDALAFLSS